MNNKEIEDYIIVEGMDNYFVNNNHRNSFESAVLDKIKLGYVPIGGVAVYKIESLDHVSQAMIKYKDHE